MEKEKQIHSDNYASEVDILGQFGRLLISLEHLDCFPSHFRTFSPIIGSLKKKLDIYGTKFCIIKWEAAFTDNAGGIIRRLRSRVLRGLIEWKTSKLL